MAFTDIFAVGFTIFACALILIAGYAAWDMIMTTDVPGYNINATYTSSDGSVNLNPSAIGTQVYGAMDWIMVFIAVMLVIGMFIAGWMLPSHPVFALLAVATALVWLVIAPFFSNAYLDLLGMDIVAAAANQFPMTNVLIMNLPLVGLIAGVLGGIATYGKSSGGAPF